MSTKTEFGLMDIPMSCSLFMEPSLSRFRHCISPLSPLVAEYIHEWNIALVEVMNMPHMRPYLGETGRKILSGTIRSNSYLLRCTEHAQNVPMHSLHYALRFTESAKFLSDKLSFNHSGTFVDFGAGLSPLAAAVQTVHNVDGAYIIDCPEIMDAYVRTAEMVGGRVPRSITWDTAKGMALSHKLDTIVAMGVFHYMPLDKQIKRMRFINSHIPNFMLEIKYSNTPQPPESNVFDTRRLQSLRLLVSDAQTLETAMIKNSLRYMSKFMHAMPNKKYYLENDRSLFLSR